MAREHRKSHVPPEQILLALETFSLHPQPQMHSQDHRALAKDPKSHTILYMVLYTYPWVLRFITTVFCICSLASTLLTHKSGFPNFLWDRKLGGVGGDGPRRASQVTTHILPDAAPQLPGSLHFWGRRREWSLPLSIWYILFSPSHLQIMPGSSRGQWARCKEESKVTSFPLIQ